MHQLQVLQQLIRLLKKMQQKPNKMKTWNPAPSLTLPSQYLANSSLQELNYDEYCYHPNQIAMFITRAAKNQITNIPRFIKWLAFAAFCQPALVKCTQQAIQTLLGTRSIFSLEGLAQFGENLVILLEAVNVFCITKGFSLQLLQISSPPEIHPSLAYADALWKNALPHLTKRTCLKACQFFLGQVPIEPTLQLIDFLNAAYSMKEKVYKSSQESNYFEENYKNMTAAHEVQTIVHDLDIALSKYNCLVTAQYLPADYHSQYIEVWVSRTVELNSLLGNFVCKEKFGQFEYVKGPLMYAAQKGIMLVLNNFEHISNELLVGMRTLAEEMKIFHNQKVIEARGGFKILGLCSKEKMTSKMKQMLSGNQFIAHLEQPKRTVLNQLPVIRNQENQRYLIQTLTNIQKKMGVLTACKLWKRIERARKGMVGEGEMWDSFFTQGFKDSVELEIFDLLSKTDLTRTIHYEQKYNKMVIGRATVAVVKKPTQKIVKTQYALSILERLALCSELGQTPLLISQTGCGKTTLVQYLAEMSGHHLYVYNMSSGTDVMDLVGGFKPVDCRSLLKQLFFRFLQKFRTIPGAEKNEQYLQDLMKFYTQDQLKRLLPSLSASIVKIKQKVSDSFEIRQWDQLKHKFDNIYANLSKIDSNLVFSFMEGNLIKALRNGDWVLIDEINMATNDVLQKIVPLIEGKSLLLYEKGDLTYIQRHQDFKIIACMNPANDSGKKPLPPNLMEKFTAINLPEPLRMDIEMMIKQITPQLNPSQIADIYFLVKKQKTISLRNLARCLTYLNRNKDTYTFKRALYDALVLGFQHKVLLKKFKDSTPPNPNRGFTIMHGFLIENGEHVHEGEPEVFHLTETFEEHLKDFLRAIAGTELPVLLEGPTSAGKTSIIRYVASVAGHRCIRINNHEHTEIEEYLGNYFPDRQGKLIFREGPLVQAVREGHWLILDELNLARTEILECLNRLLDDNRELFIPEQQTHIKPHKNFRIFATQNPASYSGRKTLSRAFRNRFISLSFDDITVQDTMAIMKVRRPILKDSVELCSYVQKTLESLQNYRQKQRVFSKDSVITIRDLLKWTGRKFYDKISFMREGYALLVQRLRTLEEKNFVEGVLLTGTKVQQFDMPVEYEKIVQEQLSEEVLKNSNIYVQMNKSFKRMAALTLKAVKNNEAVLLVGQTGCGKTTLAELLASISGRKFYSINCHKHTEASDLLGCLRPCVKPNSINKFEYVNGVVIDAMLDGAVLLIDEINTAEDSVLERLNQVLESNNIGVERGEGWETVTAKEGFCIIATMNPSGDYGKKQLSPALRNRFTEIWVEPITHPQYILDGQEDIKQMIKHKLSKPISSQVYENRDQIADRIFAFIRDYNCEMAPRYGLSRKLLTMRDIGWICKFMTECSSHVMVNWQSRYFWALRILAVEGVNFMMGDLTDSAKLSNLKDQLVQYIRSQVSVSSDQSQNELDAISIVKQLTFPLLIKTDLPLELLGIKPDERIFFSPHTELSDLLGQFRPKGTDFIWEDESLLRGVKNGQRVALMDLNLAQQPVIEGINSLFDHRGSIFVVQLNETFVKDNHFKPIVVLKETAGCERRGLPNSFLNRFIKIRVKDVSKGVKLAYLQGKYSSNSSDSGDNRLWSYIEHVLITNPKVKIEWLEFVCELYRKDQTYLERAIQILQLPPLQCQSSIRYYPSIRCEEQLLKLLPLTHKHKNEHQYRASGDGYRCNEVPWLMKGYMILKSSNFSVCLIGNVTLRQKMVEWLGYSLKKHVVKVILSTMTDMADLLGSYEQVEDAYEDQGDETTVYQCEDARTAQHLIQDSLILLNKRHNKHKTQGMKKSEESRTTNFRYIESQIMKTVKSNENNILYIEVPNEMMLERVEKGIKCVYKQEAKIIVGVDLNPNTLTMCSNTKLIPIVLDHNAPQSDVSSTSSFFKPNHSEVIEQDEKIRLLQTQQWVQHHLDEENRRKVVKAWQKLYVNIKQDRLASYAKVDLQVMNTRAEQILAALSASLGFKKREQTNLNNLNEVIQYFKVSKEQLKQVNNKEQHGLIEKIIELFTHQTLTSNNTILQFNEEEESSLEQESNEINQNTENIYNCNMGHKFRYLYVTDSAGEFRDQATRLLGLCYHKAQSATPTQLIAYNEIVAKLLAEVEKMYLSSCEQHKQLLIPYSATQHKLIPILHSNNKKSVYHYALTNIPYSVNKLIGLDVDLGAVLWSNLEKQIIKYMGLVEINYQEVGRWTWNLNVRDLVIFEMMAHQVIKVGADHHSHTANQLKQVLFENQSILNVVQNVVQSTNNQPVDVSGLSPLKLAFTLFHTFKPSSDPYTNLIYHIQTEAQMRTLEQLAEQDQEYMEVYRKMCQARYSGYLPNSFRNIETKVNEYKRQFEEIKAKRYVYRGYDNLKLLKDFYQELGRKCQEIEQSGFEIKTIATAMQQLYNGYYQAFKDILWPILMSLVMIHAEKITLKFKESNSSITQTLLGKNTKSFNRAIELILHKEEEQFHDAAKNYTKLQRKFNKTVIIDEYTEEGVAKNKENEEEEFKQFFGKADVQQPSTVLDELYMLVKKRSGGKFKLKLLKQLFEHSFEFHQFVVGFELKFPSSVDQSLDRQKISIKTQINIYEDYSLAISHKLASPIPKILEQTRNLLGKYNIDSVKVIGSLCNKIQQHKAHDQVYKILVDCEFLIEKIYELYPVLPMAERISAEELQNLCMSVRRVELENWKLLLDVKLTRVEKADTLEFIHFYRNFVQIGTIGQTQSIQVKECFKMCDDFLSQSKISCYDYRMYLLQLVSDSIAPEKSYLKHTVNRVINFYFSLREPIMEHWENVKKQKIKEVADFQKLTKWDSNNFLIFKQTCERIQKKIHRILKKYEEELSMQIGVFHGNMRAKSICQSIQDFSTVHKMKQESQRMFSELSMEEEKESINTFEEVVEKIFSTLQEIKQEHHNTQSKMLLIRSNLDQLQELVDDLPKLSSASQYSQSSILAADMFPEDHPEYYSKAVKYYFGMWDRLCQKTQTSWNRAIVEQVWGIAEKIWLSVNSRIPKYSIEIQSELDDETDNILIIFDQILENQSLSKEEFQKNHHPIFLAQFEKIKSILRERQAEFTERISKKYQKIQNVQQMISLMKVGYIVSSIALNLQKNGLCVKQNQEQGEQSGTQEVGDGVGIGEGQAHEGAKNVGDEIQFEQQLQGNKDEQKNEDANANKKQENDIEMEGDFNGDLYSKQQQEENEDENSGNQKDPDEQMGEVDNKEREQDMKNDKGKAEGEEEADVEINGQQEGEQELVDNQQEQKQGRKGENREQADDEEEDQKSDWEDNNEQGQKINKQQSPGEMEEESEGNESQNSGEQLSSVDNQEKGKDDGEQQGSGDSQINQENENENNQLNEDNAEQSEKLQSNGEYMQDEIMEEPQEDEDEGQKQKKAKKTRRTNLEAYGRTDMNSNNPLKNNEDQNENDEKINNDGAADVAGENDGERGNGQPVHSLSADLLKQIENLQRVIAKQNAQFMKDLNVVANDEQNQDQAQNRERQQQYQLTQEQNKAATNLPAFVEQENKIEEERKTKKDEKNNQERKQKELKKDQSQKNEKRNQSKLEKSKGAQMDQRSKIEENSQMKSEEEELKKEEQNKNREKQDKNNIVKQETILQVSHEEYLKSIVAANKKQQQQEREMRDEGEQNAMRIMEQAFDISKILEEQLKSVLEPMDNAEYRGDYKTGKKLNLKKIIPFIASNFRKDKIWLRRTEPSQRNYYIMLALDDTKSMHHGGVGTEALKGLLAISLALQHLSIKTCITGIRDSMKVYKNFQGLLEPDKLVHSFDFTHQSKRSHDLSVASFMEQSLEQFRKSESAETGVENKQLCFIISDGKMNKDYVRPYLRQAKKRDIIYVFIIVDSEKTSILTTQSVSFENGNVKMKPYMSDFPFEYFLIVRNVQELGDVLATTLLQFIQEK